MTAKIRVILLVALFFLFAALGIAGTTYGWFGHAVTFTTEQIAGADLRYTETGAFIADGTVIVPGQELLATAIAVDNDSPVTSQLRVQVTYTKCTNPGTVTCVETTYAASADHLAVVFGNDFYYISGYWYYSPGGSSTTYAIAAASGPLSVITSILYDGAETGIDYDDQPVTVSVTIQIKQADNVAWIDLAGYDFSTGYPA